jgi:hypothetical protein
MNQPPVGRKERRIVPRRTPKKSSKLACYKGSLGLGTNQAVSLLDVSETGIRLVVKSALEKGQEIILELLGPGHIRPVKVPAIVIWSVATADGTHCIGARFQRRLPYADMQKLI